MKNLIFLYLLLIIPVYQCQKCDETCKTCIDKSPDHCLSCYDGYFLENNKCLPCDKTCKTCSNSADHCLNCYDGYLQEISCNHKIALYIISEKDNRTISHII